MNILLHGSLSSALEIHTQMIMNDIQVRVKYMRHSIDIAILHPVGLSSVDLQHARLLQH